MGPIRKTAHAPAGIDPGRGMVFFGRMRSDALAMTACQTAGSDGEMDEC